MFPLCAFGFSWSQSKLVKPPTTRKFEEAQIISYLRANWLKTCSLGAASIHVAFFCLFVFWPCCAYFCWCRLVFDVQQRPDAKDSQTESLNWNQMSDASCSPRIPRVPDCERGERGRKSDKEGARGVLCVQKVDQMISGDVSPLNEPTFHCGSQDCTVVKKLLFEVTSTASQWQCARKLPCERTAPQTCDFFPPNIHCCLCVE